VVAGGCALGVAAPSLAGGTTPVPFPRSPEGLQPPGPVGAALDAPPPYQPQLACVARPMPGLVRLQQLVLETYGRGYGEPYVRACTSGGASEHKDGRAWDWMLDLGNTRDRAAAGDFLAWLTKDGRNGTPGVNARRLGVMYVIYNRKWWSMWAADEGWQPYSGYDPHTSHIHISLSWNGARAHTSFWTGHTWPLDYGTCQVFTGQPAVTPPRHPRTTPCEPAVTAPRTSARPLLWMGSTGATVSEAQRRLGATVDGVFGATTRSAVLRYQRRRELPRTGAVDGPTWAALDPTSVQRNVPRWTAGEAMAWAKDAGYPVLDAGEGGKAIYALQTALELPGRMRTGFFGKHTKATVVALKSEAGMAKTPRVDADVWALLR
jgi:hypothetical protein